MDLLDFQVMLQVLDGHHPDDIAFPGIGEPPGPEYGEKNLVPRGILDVNLGGSLDPRIHHDVLAGGLGKGAEDDIDVRIAHGHGYVFGGQVPARFRLLFRCLFRGGRLEPRLRQSDIPGLDRGRVGP